MKTRGGTPVHRPAQSGEAVKPVVAVYFRVSTEEQRERQSIETQKDFAAKYCGLHGVSFARTYADDGVSGIIPLESRPEGRKMLQDACRGEFNQLLIYKLDRLGRDNRLILNSVDELANYGVRVRSLTEEFDTSTATGKLMLGLLATFAAHEREQIRERSIAGTNRLAHAGTWLGGIVPFGYRKEGEKAAARLVPSDDEIPLVGLSEAQIIQAIFLLAAVERKSCRRIADHLNQLGVPCAYVRDGRFLRGKRQERTSGLWRAGRVRNLIISKTYMGRHEYGKRSKNPQREIIVRGVPALVTEEIWTKAQQTLEANFIFGPRNTRSQYLLRGLMKCGLCGLTYIGLAAKRASGKIDFYYRCNGKHGTRGLYGEHGQRCPSKDVNGSYLERLIWADIEAFLRNPRAVLDQLSERMNHGRKSSPNAAKRLDNLNRALKDKSHERDKILTLFRKGHIEDAALELQLAEIRTEEEALRSQIENVERSSQQACADDADLATAESLLRALAARLDQPITWELQRQFAEILVAGITIDTHEGNGKRENVVHVRYRFAETVNTCTGMGSSPRPA